MQRDNKIKIDIAIIIYLYITRVILHTQFEECTENDVKTLKRNREYIYTKNKTENKNEKLCDEFAVW